MRELKFRLWSKRTNRYIKTCIVDGVAYNEISAFDLFGLRSSDAQFQSEIIIEQYTGLKDKNGKEIYERDIVKFDCGDQTPAEVVYQAGSYFLKAIDDGSLFYDPETDKPCSLGWLETWGLEVIGNIHENKELLK